jgi:hypothetical protein
MSAPEVGAPPGAPLERLSRRSIRVEEGVLLGLVLLSALGIAISNASSDRGFRYWLWMVPVFGALSAVAAGSEARRRGGVVAPAVGREVLHWSGLAVAVYLIYLLQMSGRIAEEALGPVALLALALTCYLAGIRANWRFCVVGAILACGVAVTALIEQFLWLLALPALGIAVAAGLLWMRGHRAKGGDA